MLLTMRAEKSAFTLSTSFKRKQFLNELQKSDNLTKHAVKQALLKCLRDCLSNAEEKKFSHAQMSKEKKDGCCIDLPLTEIMFSVLLLFCSYWERSNKTGTGRTSVPNCITPGSAMVHRIGKVRRLYNVSSGPTSLLSLA